MKEPYKKGVATHLDPESCHFRRKAGLEALTGAPVGWVLSSEIDLRPGRRRFRISGRQHGGERHREIPTGPAESETLATPGNSMRENREAPWPPCPQPGRAGGRKR